MDKGFTDIFAVSKFRNCRNSERSSAQNSDSNKIWRTFLAQIDRKYRFGAAILRTMIPTIWRNNLAKIW
jgi:hypothetical protein